MAHRTVSRHDLLARPTPLPLSSNLVNELGCSEVGELHGTGALIDFTAFDQPRLAVE